MSKGGVHKLQIVGREKYIVFVVFLELWGLIARLGHSKFTADRVCKMLFF